MTDEQIAQRILSLEALIAGFHACKNIRAWAAEENQATKRAALALVGELLAEFDKRETNCK